MTKTPSRSPKFNAGDGKGVSENAPRGTANGRINLLGRIMRLAHSIPRGPKTEIALKVAFGCFSVVEAAPNDGVDAPSRRHRNVPR